MIYRFSYEGNTPSKKNQKRIVRRKSGAPFIMASTDHQQWHKAALLEVMLQRSRMLPRFPLPRCKHVICKLFFKDRRRRDASNTFESIMDLLVDAKILADDSWAITGPIFLYPTLRPDRPGWEIALVTYDPAPGPSAVHHVALSPEAPSV